MRSRGIFLCIIAALCWGSIGIFVKKISGVTSIGIASFRLLIAFLGLLIIIIYLRHDEVIRSLKDWKIFIPLSFLMSVHFILSVKGYVNTTVANASLLNNTTALFVPIMALCIHEKTNLREWIGIIIGYIGVSLVFYDNGISINSIYFWGNLYAFLAAFGLAIYVVISRQIRRNYSALTIMFWIFGLGGIFILVGGLLIGDMLVTNFVISDLYHLLGIGLIGSLAGHSLFSFSLKHIKASTAGIVSLLAPISAVIYAVVFLAEIPTIMSMIGISVASLGIITVLKNQP